MTQQSSATVPHTGWKANLFPFECCKFRQNMDCICELAVCLLQRSRGIGLWHTKTGHTRQKAQISAETGPAGEARHILQS